jgi:hypothetical protein
MVRDAEATADNAEGSSSNDPGMCLQWSRQRADIGAVYPDAATAWRHAVHRHKSDRDPPRGAMVYWLGGSAGYGHIAVGLGGGKVRSTDAGGAGRVATVALGWVEDHWGLPYAGWADNVNDQIIPGVGDEMSGDDWNKLREIVREEVEQVWEEKITVTKPGSGEQVPMKASQIVRETWQKVTKAT